MSKPLFFYKFVPFERKDILENGLIRFTQIGEFNDPFELDPFITSISRQCLSYCSELSEFEVKEMSHSDEDYKYSCDRFNLIDDYKEKFRNEIGNYGVLSLSTNNEINQLITICIPDEKDPRVNILMWSHYAESHRGFVIEFKSDFIEGLDIRPVDYSDVRDCLTFEDIDEKCFDHIFYKKSTKWKYEQEFRAVLPLEKAVKINDGKFHLFEINKSSINSITFGSAMSKVNKDSIMKFIQADGALKNVIFNHAKLNDEGFLLDFYFDNGKITNNPESLFSAKTIPIQKKF
jgi:hypothetical protein